MIMTDRPTHIEQLFARAREIWPDFEHRPQQEAMAHAVAEAIRRAPRMPQDSILLVNLSGRGDKDLETIIQALGI